MRKIETFKMHCLWLPFQVRNTDNNTIAQSCVLFPTAKIQLTCNVYIDIYSEVCVYIYIYILKIKSKCTFRLFVIMIGEEF